MPEPIILVCGFGRCGTSLLMQMLDAGGIPTIGEYPAFEDDRTGIDRDLHWIAKQSGKALKLLDPHYPCGPFIPGKYIIIWLDRDHRQQSLSQAKLARTLMGLSMGRNAKRALESSYRKDLPLALKILKNLGPVLRLRFENILSEPLKTAQRINAHLGRGDIKSMALQVRPRAPKCADGLYMEIALLEKMEFPNASL